MTWDRFARFLKHNPLPGPIAIHSVCRPVATSDMTSRVPELGKPGSVGAWGSNPQGDPANSAAPIGSKNRPRAQKARACTATCMLVPGFAECGVRDGAPTEEPLASNACPGM